MRLPAPALCYPSGATHGLPDLPTGAGGKTQERQAAGAGVSRTYDMGGTGTITHPAVSVNLCSGQSSASPWQRRPPYTPQRQPAPCPALTSQTPATRFKPNPVLPSPHGDVTQPNPSPKVWGPGDPPAKNPITHYTHGGLFTQEQGRRRPSRFGWGN